MAFMRNKRRTHRALLMMAAVALLPAMGPQPRRIVHNVADGSAPRLMTPLTVRNDNFYDIHVYALRDGVYESLGMVMSFTTSKFEIPERMTAPGADFRLIADPIGGSGAYVSDPLLVSAGDALEMTVRNELNLSSVITQATS
jgi:hypothetical protein